MSSCLFSFSFIGHIMTKIKICRNCVSIVNFLVTFLLLTTNTALYEEGTRLKPRTKTLRPMSIFIVQPSNERKQRNLHSPFFNNKPQQKKTQKQV